jgi:hypothetical protein
MSVLRKEEPLSTADIAGRQRATEPQEDAVLDQREVEPGERRPPRSVEPAATAGQAAADYPAHSEDTYDGADLGSKSRLSTPPRPQTVPSGSGYSAEAAEADRASQTPPTSSDAVPAAAGAVPAATQIPATQTSGSRNDNPAFAPLFAEGELRNFRARWDQVQTSFVDEPRHAVEQADTLVATVVKRIAEQFAEERAKLEQQWDRGENVSTEDLRQVMKRYRAFFDRLLSF